MITLVRCRLTQDPFAHVNVLNAPWPVVYSQFAFWKQSRSTFHRRPILYKLMVLIFHAYNSSSFIIRAVLELLSSVLFRVI